ncbi:AAA family ATPase [Rossellomorea aquimaris]|uniref:AAA family ATPase n=1 Tax=Rossellomorea aquimaris TaxID=189382 RepID=UPI0011E8D5CB|nr:AAA family ATPase [Rossellomorea aquimaris]TYS89955.1 AAA domain-containing protein [Rossellomorea aquimaris]
MTNQELERQLLKDSYIDISFKRYLQFKNNSLYDESYKEEILSRLNNFMGEQDITEYTVVDIARKLQKENPTAGSFVHWSNTADLVKYAEERPSEVADLLNELIYSSAPLEERIEAFREKGKEFNSTISLGAPLFGYILAALDYTKYPLYKQEVFMDLKRSYGIDLKLSSVGSNYQTYLQLCEISLAHLMESYVDMTILDIQDFFFCSTQYDQIKVESAVDYLYGIATELHSYKLDPQRLLDTLSKFDSESLQTLKGQYKNSQKVNLIKSKVIDKIIEFGSVTIEELEEIKNEVKVKYETNILNSWNDFTILFQLYYADKKAKVQEEQRKIHEALRKIEEFKEFELVKDKVLNGFNWNQNFGCSECWLAVYEKGHISHKTAPQLFVSVDEKGIRYGLLFGSEHPRSGEGDFDRETNIDSFTYDKLHEKMVNILTLFKEVDREGFQVEEESLDIQYYYEDNLSIEMWLELLQDEAVFMKSDLVYLQKMHELGGGATPTQLAAALGRHYSSFNTPVVQLAKRVLRSTGIGSVKNEDGSSCYWCVLFNGKNEENGHFKWILKPNLKEALSAIPVETEEVFQPYSKEDFLEEVFIDDDQYNKITSLLRYKKNIILQGPPGVGKTFVSKRLAYSLMGVKDSSRIEMVQFHQNYAYEDFVMGFRPDKHGFSLQYGVFYDFCQRALENPGEDYYFIIDEINRGNLSKVFGELFMLIERDKRDEYVTMGYSKKKFTVPSNVYLIGTMNTADRSLAQLEVALRRRFAFITLEPAFNEKWYKAVQETGVSVAMMQRITNTVTKINDEIVKDFQLGAGYAIGHSFFAGKPEEMDEEAWYQGVLMFEIQPLLEEYFFDRPEIFTSLVEGL